MIDGMRAAALPLSAGLVGLGLAAAGFFAYNKVDDLKDWVADNWADGFGLVNDPAQTQEQVTQYVSERVMNPDLKGMSTFEIYRLHYDMRDDICQFFSRLWCQYKGLDWTGPNHQRFLQEEWATSKFGTPIQGMPTFRFERAEVITVAGENVNEISEYTYQMIIRETDSRNTQARVISGLQGAISTGIGAAFSEGMHWALRSSGFMRGSDGWDGQNWEEAGGANFDPLLNYAWARTDFKTGKWWSTVDSQGDIAFWMDVSQGLQGGARIDLKGMRDQYPNLYSNDIADYEQIIWNTHLEIQRNEFGPFLQYVSNFVGWHWVFQEMSKPAETGDENGMTREDDAALNQEAEDTRTDEEREHDEREDAYLDGDLGDAAPPEREEYGPPRS